MEPTKAIVNLVTPGILRPGNGLDWPRRPRSRPYSSEASTETTQLDLKAPMLEGRDGEEFGLSPCIVFQFTLPRFVL